MQLLSLKASPSAARHRYLLLSSDESSGAAGAWTSVLAVGEDGLQVAQLPGLHTDVATLAAGPLAGGCMLQITPQVRRAGLERMHPACAECCLAGGAHPVWYCPFAVV